jgi:hypothetical protein
MSRPARASTELKPATWAVPIHSGSHGEYAKAVDEQLKTIEGRFNAGQLSKVEARATTGRLLDSIRNLLQSGRFPNMNDQALAQAVRNLAL